MTCQRVCQRDVHQIQGVGEVAAQTAQSRLQKQVDDMRKELAKAYSSFDKLA